MHFAIYLVLLEGIIKLVTSENIIINIGVIADICSNPTRINESVVTSTSAWDKNLTVRTLWRYIDNRESYALLISVLELNSLNVDSILLVDNIVPIGSTSEMISSDGLPLLLSIGIVNTTSNSKNAADDMCLTRQTTPSGAGLSKKSNCVPPIKNPAAYFLPESRDSLNLLGLNVVSVIQYLQWTSLVLLYEKVSEEQVDRIIVTLSRSRTLVTAHRIDSVETMNNILLQIDRSDLQFTNITVICQTNCTTTVMAAAGQYVESKQRISSLRHRSRWLIFELTDGLSHTWSQHSENIDNVACVTLPLYVLGKGETSKKVDSLIKRALYTVGSNESLSNMKKSSLNTALISQLELDMQKCHWSPVNTLMWTTNGRGWSNVGYMDIDGRLSVNANIFPNSEFGFNGRKFNVSTLEWDPFVKYTRGRYEGICFDLLEQLSLKMNFTYYTSNPPDGQWGVMNNGTWTGMVGQLAKQEVDIVVAPLSTQAVREEVMDFTYSFFIDYTTILVRKPQPTKWRTLIDPFSNELLICIVISLPVMSLLLFLLERFSPYYMDEYNKADRSGLHTYQDSFWYMYGALLTQGGEHLPRSQTGRTLLGSWWLFCLILMATYSGNLIAFLTVNKSKLPFNGVSEMVNQETYTWGTIGGSSWVTAFKGSRTSEFQAVWRGIVEFNATDPVVLSHNPEDHFNKVKNDEYAYIGDQAQMEIKMSTECDLVMLDDKFMPLQYAFGLPNYSPYTKLFSDEMISIHESGLLHIWKTRRWPRKNICAGELVTVAKVISLIDVQSAFYIIIIGVVFGFLVLLVENIYPFIQKRKKLNTRDVAKTDANGNKTLKESL